MAKLTLEDLKKIRDEAARKIAVRIEKAPAPAHKENKGDRDRHE